MVLAGVVTLLQGLHEFADNWRNRRASPHAPAAAPLQEAAE
jgi:hypothetical protein